MIESFTTYEKVKDFFCYHENGLTFIYNKYIIKILNVYIKYFESI